MVKNDLFRFLLIFYRQGEKYYLLLGWFIKGEIESTLGQIDQNTGKLQFGCRGSLVTSKINPEPDLIFTTRIQRMEEGNV